MPFDIHIEMELFILRRACLFFISIISKMQITLIEEPAFIIVLNIYFLHGNRKLYFFFVGIIIDLS